MHFRLRLRFLIEVLILSALLQPWGASATQAQSEPQPTYATDRLFVAFRTAAPDAARQRALEEIHRSTEPGPATTVSVDSGEVMNPRPVPSGIGRQS